jgi:hypothetical protein
MGWKLPMNKKCGLNSRIGLVRRGGIRIVLNGEGRVDEVVSARNQNVIGELVSMRVER